MASIEYVVNNKVHSTTRIFLFMVNYDRELRIEVNIRKKEKMKKVMEFVERMKRV